MTRTATRPKPVTAAETAQWLLDRGVGLIEIQTDEGLARKIADAFIARGARLGSAPNDYDAVRNEVARLAFAAERVGRSALCGRYRPDFMPTRVQ